MSSNSENSSTSDVSSDEAEAYHHIIYDQMVAGQIRVRRPNGTLKCPFCVNRRRQVWDIVALRQHVRGISRSFARNRSTRMRARHWALVQYIDNVLHDQV